MSWTANSTDPLEFTLWWDDLSKGASAFHSQTITREKQNSGEAHLGLVPVGTYTTAAVIGSSKILASTTFHVVAFDSNHSTTTSDSVTITTSEPTSTLSYEPTCLLVHKTLILSFRRDPTSSREISQTNSDIISAPTSTRNPVLPEVSSRLVSGKSSTTKLSPSSPALLSTIVGPSSTTVGGSSVGGSDNGSNLPKTARKNIASLVGGIIGGLICLGLVLLWIFCLRLRKRRRVLNLIAIPYQSASLEGLLPIRVPHFLASKPRLRHGSEPDPNQTSVAEKPTVERGTPETIPTERQRTLQARVAEIDRQLEESEAALSNMPDAAPDLTRAALITENTRLQRENQVLRDLNRSDWALGLTDVPPPSYPHSETSSE
ncbi:hypothetical protein C8J56DRAFT_1025986 [Mycena floridula]|nr:hypothetical protein C8J56DRAFT_1025986 [Mycena floridula]